MKKTKNQPTVRDDATMIADPYLWPCWPYLPVKRYVGSHGGPECGLLLATETPWSAIYLANLFRLPPTQPEFIATKGPEYPSVEALLHDGWVVD